MTKIEWAKNPDGSQGVSWNPISGCTKVSPGCAHCYAERMARRYRGRLFVKQLRIDGKLVRGIDAFPPDLQIREFPNALRNR